MEKSLILGHISAKIKSVHMQRNEHNCLKSGLAPHINSSLRQIQNTFQNFNSPSSRLHLPLHFQSNMPPQPSPAAPRPIEVILSCTCCQKTIAEVYQYAEGDKSFRHDSDNTTAQPVPKLWMTECAHLICSDHLGGGGWQTDITSK